MTDVTRIDAKNNDGQQRQELKLSPEEVWDSLTDVEETAVHVSLYRYCGCSLPHGATPLYDNSYDQAIVDACMPAKEREKHSTRANVLGIVAVRTAEIDEQVLHLLEAHPEITQVMLLGAGLDTRAWRLRWPRPESTTVFEVDTGSLESVKLRALAGFKVGPKRVFVQADLAKVDDLRVQLLGAGFKRGVPTIWVMEGLVGYLTTAQSYRLFRMTHTLSPPGSRVILTCPPSLADRVESEKRGFKLYHATFEDPEATFQRLVKAGWSGHINNAEDLTKKYGVQTRQSQVIGCKPGVTPKSLAAAALLVVCGTALMVVRVARGKKVAT